MHMCSPARQPAARIGLEPNCTLRLRPRRTAAIRRPTRACDNRHRCASATRADAADSTSYHRGSLPLAAGSACRRSASAVPAPRPDAGAVLGAARCPAGCRCASRSAGRRAGRSAPPGRSRARAGSPARSPGPSGWRASTTSTRRALAGESALPTNCAGSSDQSMMSIFSPCSSLITARTRWPIGPMQAPLALTPGDRRADRDLGAVTGLTGDGGDLHRAVGDLRHLQREQLLHQGRVRARQGDLRAAEALGHVHHDAADPRAVRVRSRPGTCSDCGSTASSLPRSTMTMPFSARASCGLHDAGDQVTVAADVLAEVHLVGGLPQPLQDHLLGGHRRDPAEVVRGVVPLADQRAVRVELLRVAPGPRRSCGRSPPGRGSPRPRCAGTRSAARSRSPRGSSRTGSPARAPGRAAPRGRCSPLLALPILVVVHVVFVESSSIVVVFDVVVVGRSSSSASSTRLNSICTRPGPSSA